MKIKITRTANAGVLLEMDGKRILFDGVCPQVSPYLGTPANIRQDLSAHVPDVCAYTHKHDDHYDSDYYEECYEGPLFGTEEMLAEIGNGLALQSVKTRHIGKTEEPHVSFVLTGSSCVWFMGDASPNVLKGMKHLPAPDILIVPYAYALTPPAWRDTKATGAKKIILLHLPDPKNDPYSLWDGVREITQSEPCLLIPEIGQTITND